jgi:hypothetical protein
MQIVGRGCESCGRRVLVAAEGRGCLAWGGREWARVVLVVMLGVATLVLGEGDAAARRR